MFGRFAQHIVGRYDAKETQRCQLDAMACRFPNDPKLKGLAAVTCRSDIPSHKFDIRAVPEDVEVAEVSDWHRRKGRSPAGREYLRQAAREANIPRPPYER